MKKFLSILLIACTLCTGMPAFAFSDISNPEVSRAADALASLGIMTGIGGDSFSPNASLTRGQFCKLAVLALGTTDVTTYQNYTIFPDVPRTHWAAGYINTAVKKYTIIKGFPNGKFEPDRALSLGEACTMFLSMLGYKVEDIGPFWPNDYILKAEALGITDGVTIKNAGDTVSRGDAAIMLRNILGISKKDGAMLLKSAFPNIVEGSVLLATYETDSELSHGQARFFEGSDSIERYMTGSIGQSLIGSRGYVVLDTNEKTKVKGFLPESQAAQAYVIKKSYADKLETTTGTLKPTSSTPVVLNGKKIDYSKAWVDIVPDQKINVFYDEGGKIDMIAVVSNLTQSSSFVFGTSSGSSLPVGFAIKKNGAAATLADLKQYDIVSVSSTDRTVAVTDKRITGRYQKATPSYSYPSSITILGKEYQIPESVRGFFKEMKYNDQITILFDSFGNVAAAYPSSVVQADMLGVISGLDSQSKTVNVSLLNGITLSTNLENSEDDVASLINQMVTVSQYKNGNIYLSKSGSPLKVSGNWDIAKGVMGSTPVLPRVMVYEQVDEDAPINEIDINDIDLQVIESKNILRTLTDSAGKVRAIVINDITGNSYNYGLAYNHMETEESDDSITDGTIKNHRYYVKLKNSDNTEMSYSVTHSYDINNTPVGIPKGMERFKSRVQLSVKKLIRVDTVSLDKFDGDKGVRTTGGYYPLADNIKVYVKDYSKFIELSEAKANFKSFRIYTDKTLSDGGKVRLIYAESLKPDSED